MTSEPKWTAGAKSPTAVEALQNARSLPSAFTRPDDNVTNTAIAEIDAALPLAQIQEKVMQGVTITPREDDSMPTLRELISDARDCALNSKRCAELLETLSRFKIEGKR